MMWTSVLFILSFTPYMGLHDLQEIPSESHWTRIPTCSVLKLNPFLFHASTDSHFENLPEIVELPGSLESRFNVQRIRTHSFLSRVLLRTDGRRIETQQRHVQTMLMVMLHGAKVMHGCFKRCFTHYQKQERKKEKAVNICCVLVTPAAFPQDSFIREMLFIP